MSLDHGPRSERSTKAFTSDEFKFAFKEAFKKHLIDLVLHSPDYDSCFERGWEKWRRARDGDTMEFVFRFTLVYGDTIFMPYLVEAAKNGSPPLRDA